MPRKNVPGGRKTSGKAFNPEGDESGLRRKRMPKKPKYKNKIWLDEIDDDEDFDIFDRDTESE